MDSVTGALNAPVHFAGIGAFPRAIALNGKNFVVYTRRLCSEVRTPRDTHKRYGALSPSMEKSR